MAFDCVLHEARTVCCASLGMALQPVRAALERARAKLERRKDGDAEEFKAVSGVEKRALCAMLLPITGCLGDDEKSQLIDAVDALPWAGADGQGLTKVILQGAATEEKPIAEPLRRSMQDYTAFIDFMNVNDWAFLMSDEASPPAKRVRIVKVLVRLGCRCGSEETKKLATTLWLVLTGAEGIEPASKKIMRAQLCNELSAACKKATHPAVYLKTLPPPRELEALHPEFYTSIVPDPIMKCQIDTRRLMEENVTTKCRGSGSGCTELVRRLGPPCLQLGSCGQPNSPQLEQFEQFGRMMLKGMEQMQATNNKVLEIVLGGSGSRDRALQALQPGSLETTPHREQPKMLPPPSQLPRRALTFDRASSVPNIELLLTPQIADAPAAGAAPSVPVEGHASRGLSSADASSGHVGSPETSGRTTAPTSGLSHSGAVVRSGMTLSERKRRMQMAMQCVRKRSSSEVQHDAPAAKVSRPATARPKRESVGMMIGEMVSEREKEKAAETKAKKLAAAQEAGGATAAAAKVAGGATAAAADRKKGTKKGKKGAKKGDAKGTLAKKGDGKPSFSVERSRVPPQVLDHASSPSIDHEHPAAARYRICI